MTTLASEWTRRKAAYDLARAKYGSGSRVAQERFLDLREITNRIIARDARRRRKVA